MPELTHKIGSPDVNNSRFVCHCCGQNFTDPRLIQRIAEIELRVGEQLNVTSGYRCDSHNRKVGGSKTSSHMAGLAVDVACSGSRLRYRIVNAAISVGIDRIGIYRTFIHLDIDRSKDPRVMWLSI